ncbi:hypothetical protein ACPCZR_10015 [Bacillus bombysepticus]
MRWWINFLITVILIVLGGYIGSLFNGGKLIDTSTLYWSVIVVCFAVLAQFFAMKSSEFENEAKNYKDDMSAMLLTKKGDGSKTFDIAFDPQNLTGTFLRNSNYVCHIVINSPIKLGNPPDLEISTSAPWNITVGTLPIAPISHAEEYKYFINHSNITKIIENKYFVYEFNCCFNSSGEQKYKITAETSKLNGEIRNSIEVH